MVRVDLLAGESAVLRNSAMCDGGKMNGHIKVLFGSTLLSIALTVPALAEKVTLGCSLGPGYVTSYLTIDTDAKTVKDAAGTHPAEITDDAVTWTMPADFAGWHVPNIYDRQTGRITSGWMVYDGETHEMDPVSCVRSQSPF
jgi:hypothetical protein